MKTLLVRVIPTFAFALAAVACGPGPVESVETDTSEEALTPCQQACTDEMRECRIFCRQEMPDPESLAWCWEDCYNEYDRCMNNIYTLQGPTFAICHLDVDVHWFDVDLEFYTADAYQNVSCNGGPTKYRKRFLGKVSCSHLQLFEDFVNNGWDAQAIQNGACADRVANMTASLFAQGYFPATTEIDEDQCPTPRL